MNETNVISVNPGVKTLGELCVNEHRLARISRKISEPGRKAVAPFRRVLNHLFGINRKVNAQLSGKMMVLRLICGTLFIALALVPMSMSEIREANFTADSIALCAAGISMAAGLFSRLTTMAGAVWYGISLYNSITVSEPDAASAMLVMVMAIFCVLGPGLYSVDRYLRRAIMALVRGGKKTHRHERGISFRAYGDVDRRIG